MCLSVCVCEGHTYINKYINLLQGKTRNIEEEGGGGGGNCVMVMIRRHVLMFMCIILWYNN